jgi:hypothetical protein
MKKPKPSTPRRTAARRSRIDPHAARSPDPAPTSTTVTTCRCWKTWSRAFTVNESVLTSRSSFDDGAAAGAGKSGLADDTIKALLGDEWRAQARKTLSDARSTVEGRGSIGRPNR